MDAVRVAAAAALLVTALMSPGCGRPKQGPVEPPPPAGSIARVGTLRVGLPSARRSNLLFRCDSLEMDATRGHAIDVRSPHAPIAYRWTGTHEAWGIAESGPSSGAPLDTLLLTPFDESTDEEIALERDELDVAVFWPGELSARMRGDARWREPAMTLLPQGVVVSVSAPGDTLGVPPDDMLALNRDVFAGDLLAWSNLGSAPPSWAPARYSVDSTMPGSRLIERVLAKAARPGASRTVKLVYVNRPIHGENGSSFDVERPAWLEPGMTPVFAVRCPILVSPHAADAFRALGTDPFAQFLSCAGAAPR